MMKRTPNQMTKSQHRKLALKLRLIEEVLGWAYADAVACYPLSTDFCRLLERAALIYGGQPLFKIRDKLATRYFREVENQFSPYFNNDPAVTPVLQSILQELKKVINASWE